MRRLALQFSKRLAGRPFSALFFRAFPDRAAMPASGLHTELAKLHYLIAWHSDYLFTDR